MNQWHQPSPHLYLCHSYCLVSLKDTVYIKSSRVSSKVFQNFFLNTLQFVDQLWILLASMCLYLEHVLWFNERTSNPTSNDVENSRLRKNSRKELLATSRLLSYAEAKNKKSKLYIYVLYIYIFIYLQ